MKMRKCESKLMTEHGYAHPAEITLDYSDGNVDGYEHVEISVDDHASWFRCEILKQNLDDKQMEDRTMEPNKRTWKNVFTLRQEYNKYKKRWYPIVVYWNRDGRHCWLESLATEDGVTFYHAEISEGYFLDGTKYGTGHCTPEEVERILDHYKDESPSTFRVERLGAYRPTI